LRWAPRGVEYLWLGVIFCGMWEGTGPQRAHGKVNPDTVVTGPPLPPMGGKGDRCACLCVR